MTPHYFKWVHGLLSFRVKRFYANIKRNLKTRIITSHLRGRVSTLEEIFLVKLLNIPAQGWVVHSVHDWTENPISPLEQTRIFLCDDSKEEACVPHTVEIPFHIKVIQNMCYHILHPRDQDGVHCRPCNMFLVFMLMTENPVNLPRSMLQYMVHYKKIDI